MRTVTFYSYKGGTGRSLLLANVAVLAARLGRSVVAVDLDLEAPGLGYKLLNGSSQRSHGALGWLQQRVVSRHIPTVAGLLIDVAVEDPFVAGGALRLLPAGLAPSREYFVGLQDLGLDGYQTPGEIADAFVDLQDAIERELNPDLLLLDARTGVATSNLATTRVLADDVVAVTLDTPEQLEGTRAVLRSLTPLTSLKTQAPLALHVVLSRIAPRAAEVGSYAITEKEQEQVQRVRQLLEEPADPLSDTLVVQQMHVLHTELALLTGDFLPMRRSDAIESTALHLDYVRLGEALLGGDVVTAASAAIARQSEPEARERTARFFGRVDEMVEARSSQRSGDVGSVEGGADLGERVARLRRRAEDDPTAQPDLAALLLRTAALHSELGQHADAVDATVEALQIYRALEPAGASRHQVDVARSLNDLGWRLRTLERYTEALSAGEEAVAIFRQLAAAEGEQHFRNLARALDSVGITLSRLLSYDRALSVQQEAVAVLRALVKDEADLYSDDLARALGNLGITLSRLGQWEAVAPVEEEAIAILRRPGPSDPTGRRATLGWALRNYGITLSQLKLYDRAASSQQEAVAIFRELAVSEPEQYRSDLARALEGLGSTLGELGANEQALSARQEAVEISRELVTDESKSRADFGRTLASYGIAVDALDLSEQALAVKEEAVVIFREVAEEEPEVRFDLGRALRSIGVSLSNLDRNEDALRAEKEAVSIFRGLAAEDPSRRFELARALENMGITLAALDLSEQALAVKEEAVVIFREVAEEKPEVRFDLGRVLRSLGVSLSDLDRSEDALLVGREAVEILRDLAVEQPSQRAEVVRALEDLGTTLCSLDLYEQALLVEQEAVNILQELAVASPKGYGRAVARGLSRLAELYEYLDRGTEAQATRVKERRALEEFVSSQ